MKVIIADDSKAVRRHLVAMLSALDWVQVVGEAADVPHTLDSVRTLQPEAVVLDIQMPGGSGIDALRYIKREFPEIQVIMLTNHCDDFYRKKCMNEGADFFLDKSIEFEKVGEVLHTLSA